MPNLNYGDTVKRKRTFNHTAVVRLCVEEYLQELRAIFWG